MKIAIMQPYFLPYIGYFQLIGAVDKFVIYDDIQYTKKGWINRNRILQNGKDAFITIPLSQYAGVANVSDYKLAENFRQFALKQERMIEASYRKAPYFETTIEVYREIMAFDNQNLFQFIFNSVRKVNAVLNIGTEIVVSSTLQLPSGLRGAERVMAICQTLKAHTYINPIGGTTLYDKKDFSAKGIQLLFLQSNDINYEQFNNAFVPWLSILDVLMFNNKIKISEFLKVYKLI